MRSLRFIFVFMVFFSFQASAYDLKEMAKLFKEDVKNAPKDTYEDYIRSRPDVPLFISERQVFPAPVNGIKSKSISKILVITESAIYSQTESRVLRYVNDIQNVYGCTVVSQQASASIHPVALKNMLINEWNLGAINGVVLIGNLPAGWFEIENDFYEYGYAEFPCDLFLMDLNGTWTDSDSNGKYESHTGSLINPEIFVGRISTANMGTLTSELQGMMDYLDKNHSYWAGITTVNQLKGLTYTDKDWADYDEFLYDIQYLYSDYDAVTAYNSFCNKTDYLNRLSGGVYEFVQLSCHSSWEKHYMYGTSANYTLIYTNEIFSLPPKAIAYNLFCCSGVRWTNTDTDGFLGGAYVYHTGSKAMVSVGSTKTGSMLGFSDFYISLSNDRAVGQALKNWWISYVGSIHDFDEICWFYGLSIIGDPMIDPKYVAPAEPAVPLNVTTSASGTDIYISWDAVSGAASYKIYGSDDPYAPDPWVLLDSVSGTSYLYTGTENRKFFKVTASTDAVIRQNW